MIISDFYSLPRHFISDLYDLSTFITSPRSFFQKISKESTPSTVRRLFLYGFTFDLLIFVFLFPMLYGKSSISIYHILMLGTLETLLAIFPGLIFYLATRFLSIKPSLKVVISCAVTCKFLFLIPTVLFFVFYIYSESILVLILRSIFAAIGALSIPLACPFLVSPSSKRRLLVALLSLLLLFGFRLGFASLLINGRSYIAERLMIFTLAYDPVGNELDKLPAKDLLESYNMTDLLYYQKQVLASLRQEGSKVYINQKNYNDSSKNLNNEYSKIDKYVQDRISSLMQKIADAKFITTIELLKADVSSLKTLSDFNKYRIVESITDESDLLNLMKNMNNVQIHLHDYYESNKVFQSIVSSSVLPRYQLRRIGLIIW